MTAADGPSRPPAGLAIATLTFSALLVLGAVGQLLASGGAGFHVPPGLAFVPGVLFGGAEPAGAQILPPPATLVSYQFLHVGWLHLAGNLAFLWIFGPNLEETLGPGRWTVLVIACGVAAGLAQAWPEPSSPAPVVGASGGISGLLGAYLWLHPRDEFRPLWAFLPPVRLPMWVVLAAWFALQLGALAWVGHLPGAVAFRAHVGGFACGLALAPVLDFLALLSAEARPLARTRTSRDSSH